MALSKILPASQEVQTVGKNLIINGAMAVNQRNSTGQPVGNYGYGVDRWRAFNNGTARFDVSQESVTDLEGFSYCYKLAVTTAQSSYGSDISVPIEQSMEGYTTAHLSFGTSNARAVTISFYVKSSVTGDFSCAMFNGSPITRSIVQNWTVNTADTWEYKTITFAGDTTGTWRTDNLIGAYVTLAGIGGSAGTARASAANTWEAGYKNHLSTSDNIFATNSATLRFTGIQIEVGSTATDFEHRSFGDELARCDRYYQSYDLSGSYAGLAMAQCHNGTQSSVAMTFRTPMRASPSMSINKLVVTDRINYDSDISSVAVQGSSSGGVSFRTTHASNGGSAHDAQHITSKNGTTDAYARFDAELQR